MCQCESQSSPNLDLLFLSLWSPLLSLSLSLSWLCSDFFFFLVLVLPWPIPMLTNLQMMSHPLYKILLMTTKTLASQSSSNRKLYIPIQFHQCICLLLVNIPVVNLLLQGPPFKSSIKSGVDLITTTMVLASLVLENGFKFITTCFLTIVFGLAFVFIFGKTATCFICPF